MCFQMMANAAGGIHDTYAAMKLDKLRGRSMDWYRRQSKPMKDEYFSNISHLADEYDPAKLQARMGEEQANRASKINDFQTTDNDLQLGDAAQKAVATRYGQALDTARTMGSKMAKRGALDDVVFANKIDQAHSDQSNAGITSKASSLARLLQIMLQRNAANRSVMFNQMQAGFLRGAGSAAQDIYGASKQGNGSGSFFVSPSVQTVPSSGGGGPVGSSRGSGFGASLSSLGGDWGFS